MRYSTMELSEGGVSVLDCEHKTPKSLQSGHPYIAIPDIQDGRVVLSRARLISDDDLAEWTRRTTPIAGDVLVTRRGRVGDTAPIPADLRCAIGQNLVLLRSSGNVVDQEFLRWASRSPQWWSEVARLLNVGAVFSSLNVKDIARIRIPVPSLDEQRRIVGVLSALDEKISANARLCELLGQALEANFRGVVGEQRELVSLGELASVTKGVSYRSADLSDSTTALVTLKSFNRAGGYSARGLKEYVGPFKPQQRIVPGEIVVAQTDLTQAADVVGRAVRVPASREHKTLVASLDLAIVRPVTGIPYEFVLGLMLDGRFREYCRSRTSGTTVLHLASNAISTFAAPKVSVEVQLRYALRARPMLETREFLEGESESLAATRDALLPQLMSGKLRVKDAEKVLEGVL